VVYATPMSIIRRLALLALACLLLTLAPARAATFTVNSTDDAVDATLDGTCATSTGACTLRAAVQEANALMGPDVIMLPAGTYVITIPGQDEDQATTGDIDILDDVTIIGAGPSTTIVDGNQLDRVFDIPNSARITISGLTIRNGNPGQGYPFGGGLSNNGVLVLSNVVVSGNTASINGGGIENISDLTLVDSVVTGNTATGAGGGIDNALTAKLTNTTVSNNTADLGGGIENATQDMTLTNVTVSGNTATTQGGGIENEVVATLTGVTIANNAAPSGSGLYNVSDATVSYVIFANTPSGANCTNIGTAHLTSTGHNLDSGSSCGLSGPGDIVNEDPGLGPLQDNGGATPTQALLAGSPAIDTGGTDCPPPSTDQRGFTRPADGNGDGVASCDIGAYEANAVMSSTTTTTLPPGCPTVASFPSITCRLDELIQKVDTAVPQGALRTRLDAPLMKATQQTGQAQQAFAAGKKRREKRMLGQASRSVGKFLARLHPRKVQQQLGAALGPIKDEAKAVRQALMSLRG
jgi:CSLREA domain-containing protein